MPAITHTLPLILDFLQPEINLVNNANITTVTYQRQGADTIIGATEFAIAPLESLTLYPSLGGGAWRFRGFSVISNPQTHPDDGTNPTLGINTPIPLAAALNTPIAGSPQHFSVNGSGQLVAVRPLDSVFIDYTARYTANGNNSNFDIALFFAVVSGVATLFQVGADDQGSRTDSVTKTISDNVGIICDEGAVIELRGSSLGAMSIDIDGVLATARQEQ